jgi:gas vesicle protein
MENVNEPKTKLDEVKDLIFGPDIKSYNDQISELKTNIGQNREEVMSKIEEVRNKLIEAIQTTEQNLTQQIADLQKATEAALDKQKQAHVSKRALNDVLLKISEGLRSDAE